MVPTSKGARAVEVVGTGNWYGVSPAEVHSYDALLFREKGGKRDLDNIQERDESISHGVFIPVPLLFVAKRRKFYINVYRRICKHHDNTNGFGRLPNARQSRGAASSNKFQLYWACGKPTALMRSKTWRATLAFDD